MSIGKAQAEALADGFIDSIGSGSKDDLRPRKTFTEFFLMAGELAQDAVKNLNSQKKNSSGALSESITIDEPTQKGKTVSIDISMLFYGKFVNSGVKGTRSGSSTAGYQFRNEFPSENMVKAIEDWIGRAKLSTRSVKKYKGYGSHEIKNKKIAELEVAYAVAKSVKIQGLKPTGFMDKAILKTQGKIKDRLGAALKIDIINSIS